MKAVENNPQNARNCTISKKKLGVHACPQAPLATARGMYIQNQKKYIIAPPLRNPAYAPARTIMMIVLTSDGVQLDAYLIILFGNIVIP